MAYKPLRCETFTPTGVKGWICCACGHFSAWKRKTCHNCEHARCEQVLPEQPRREEPKKKPGRPKKVRQQIEK